MTGKEVAKKLRAIASMFKHREDVPAHVVVSMVSFCLGFRFLEERELRDGCASKTKRWSTAAYDSVYERDGEACRYCGEEDAELLTIDHVVPRIQGGSDDASNLVVCCKSCNSRKGGRTPEEAGMVLQ